MPSLGFRRPLEVQALEVFWMLVSLWFVEALDDDDHSSSTRRSPNPLVTLWVALVAKMAVRPK